MTPSLLAALAAVNICQRCLKFADFSLAAAVGTVATAGVVAVAVKGAADIAAAISLFATAVHRCLSALLLVGL